MQFGLLLSKTAPSAGLGAVDGFGVAQVKLVCAVCRSLHGPVAISTRFTAFEIDLGSNPVNLIQGPDQCRYVDPVSGGEPNFSELVIGFSSAAMMPEAEWDRREVRRFLTQAPRPQDAGMSRLDADEFGRAPEASGAGLGANPSKVRRTAMGTPALPFTTFDPKFASE
jgi:hypothetical protein